ASDGREPTQLTAAGFALGTPGDMSPEQALGGGVDERSDLYSIGLVLYEMISGQKPFQTSSPMLLLRMQVDKKPAPLRRAAPEVGCSAALEAVVHRALEKPPGKRWQSAADFQLALEATAEGQPTEVQIPALSLPSSEVLMGSEPTLAAVAVPNVPHPKAPS